MSSKLKSALTDGKVEAVSQIFGSDPWKRFDLWSERAWEAAQNATVMAATIDEPIGPDGSLDPRIITSFHSAGIARDISVMVNPVTVVLAVEKGNFDSLELNIPTTNIITDIWD